jgi:hypothetical protein
MEKAGLLDLAISPLTLLERSKGWKRRGLVVLYLLISLVVGVLGWRELSLWRLPDIGEPFDVAKLGTVDVPDSENAIPLYIEAEKRLKPLDHELKTLGSKSWSVTDWAVVDPVIQRWVDESRPALEPWLRAVDRGDALLLQPGEMTESSLLQPAQSIRELCRFAILEGSRLETTGEVEGAWRIYRGVLRSSRHVGRHGGGMQRLIGQSILSAARSPIGRWIENPAVTPDMLHRAIHDVEFCQSMTPPISEMIRVEYFVCRDVLSRPDGWKQFSIEGPEGAAAWYNQIAQVAEARRFLLREPERSRRVLNLVTAGLLAQCDRPRLARPKIFSTKYMIYHVDSQTPPAVASLTPEELTTWADRSAFSTVMATINLLLSRIEFEDASFDTLRLRMAERAYESEKGRPPTTYGDLLGPYLKALPNGIDPTDAISAPAPTTGPQ